jgi:hypothetical protein
MKKLFSQSKLLFSRNTLNKEFLSIQKFSNHHNSSDSSECPYINYQNHGYNLIRNKAPEFSGTAWWKNEFKKVSLSDFKGKWVVLFFWPFDFTFVCPTEIVDFNNSAEEFGKLSKYILT